MTVMICSEYHGTQVGGDAIKKLQALAGDCGKILEGGEGKDGVVRETSSYYSNCIFI